jgi:hypothetical protein
MNYFVACLSRELTGIVITNPQMTHTNGKSLIGTKHSSEHFTKGFVRYRDLAGMCSFETVPIPKAGLLLNNDNCVRTYSGMLFGGMMAFSFDYSRRITDDSLKEFR